MLVHAIILMYTYLLESCRVVIFKDCAPFSNCKIEINNKEIDNPKGIDIVMPKFHLIEYSDKYPKTSGRSWQYYKDEPNHSLINCGSFTSKAKIRLDKNFCSICNFINFK